MIPQAFEECENNIDLHYIISSYIFNHINNKLHIFVQFGPQYLFCIKYDTKHENPQKLLLSKDSINCSM